ncbi:MAG: HAMP domain-containing sensor histidine kinase [Pseudomonadota bacterium]|nr:HAMP domain-containing sensor histidine kinase [Pseudomonadota bacterium]
MKRFLPSSLLGQVMASVMLALLIAQVVSAVLLYRASEDRRELAALTTLSFHLAEGPQRLADRDADRRPSPRGPRAGRRGPQATIDNRPPVRLPRRLRYIVTDTSPVSAQEASRDPARTERLLSLLEREGIVPHKIMLGKRIAGDDPALIAFAERRPRLAERTSWQSRKLLVASIQRETGGPWETSRVFEWSPSKEGIGVLLFQTLLTFGFLSVILFLVLRRITRPLAELTERVTVFSKDPESAVKLEETGPADTRRLIAAHNAMEARISALLDEKDVMLGAIGHDLKTPLAALRVRIESVPDETQRGRMAETIEDITRTLDDILSLARIGKGRAQHEPVNVSALVASVVEEFEDLGSPVELGEDSAGRIVATVQQTWLKRAVRNLVSNAVRYGGTALVGVNLKEQKGQREIAIVIDDGGPGIPEDHIAAMLEPFKRGDASRNRSTGGAGLGLTLARAIAEAHNGSLTLHNRAEGGLRAVLTIPA